MAHFHLPMARDLRQVPGGRCRKIRNAKALPKYFGYGKGVTFYTHTSDQYSQYGTKVISSTERDAPYVLDEILTNETELTILEHTTDTHGYSDLIFAFFDLAHYGAPQ